MALLGFLTSSKVFLHDIDAPSSRAASRAPRDVHLAALIYHSCSQLSCTNGGTEAQKRDIVTRGISARLLFE